MDEIDGNCIGTRNKDELDKGLSSTSSFQKNEIVCTSPSPHNYYKMDHPNRGQALIFNHEFFDNPKITQRRGTEVDCKNITKQLQKLGFKVTIYKDYTYTQIMSVLTKAANEDYSTCDCLIVVVMTHGNSNILSAKDDDYELELIWNQFTDYRCPSLAGKPKIFIIQACRGKYKDPGIVVQHIETDSTIAPKAKYPIITQPDFIIACSSVIGYVSFRNCKEGSWFIQTLCEEMERHIYNYDLLRLLTIISHQENECFQSALRSVQKRLLIVTKDRSFLLDRLMLYEKPQNSSSESEETESSEDENVRVESSKKRKVEFSSFHSQGSHNSGKSIPPAKKKRPPPQRQPKAHVSHSNVQNVHTVNSNNVILSDGHMTPEEVERHLQSRQSFLELERAPLTVPTEMFSNEPSLDSESNDIGELETSPSNMGEELSIDMIPE